MRSKSEIRAVKYRQLALAEADKGKAELLHRIADEAEQDVLCTVDWLDSTIQRKHPKAENWPDQQGDSFHAWPFALVPLWRFNLNVASIRPRNVAASDHHAHDISTIASPNVSVAVGGPGNDSFVFHLGEGVGAASKAASMDAVELDKLFSGTSNSQSVEMRNAITRLSQFFFRQTK